MMKSPEIIKLVDQLKEIASRAFCSRSNQSDPDIYIDLRTKLIAEKVQIPEFIKDCRNLRGLEVFRKGKFINGEDGLISYTAREKFVIDEFKPLLDSLEFGDSAVDKFKQEFPFGLPIGLNKPIFAVVPDQSTQKTLFEETPKVGVIRGDVYPNFTYKKLKLCLEGQPFIPSLEIFCSICTPKEDLFLRSYEGKFRMTSEDVPVLVPQAWIQWHSEKKDHLRNEGSVYADDLMRVDFVVFWNNKRFAILVDDISHYGKKHQSGRWEADEVAYSKRLKEDRKLRKEDWIVFRLSNWEIRNGLTSEILDDLKEHIGF